MQYRNLGSIFSAISCLLVALYLSGCGGPKGFNLDSARSVFQMANEQAGTVRDFRNNLQQLMIKLNTLSNITEDRLHTVNVMELIQTLTKLSQNMTGNMGGIDVYTNVTQVFLRLPLEIRNMWNPYIVIPVLTYALNIQASYLNVAVQYMNKNATTMVPDEIKRINMVISSALGSLNTYGI